MTGAEALLRTAVAAGIEVCFANPGTTEMPLVTALDRVSGIRPILSLFEGVCTGAADGYGRMAGRPALTLLHLGPGFANGIANLHNARRARTPIVNLIGDHATWHLAADAPLTSDIVTLAKPVSMWLRRNRCAKELGADMAAAIASATAPPGGIATLIVPQDCQLNDGAEVGVVPTPPAAPRANIEPARALLRQGAALMLGGPALTRRALLAAARVTAAAGCTLICETFSARLERGAGLPPLLRFPYFPEQGMKMLAQFKSLVLAGAKSPVAFFGYPGLPSSLVPEGMPVATLATADEDVAAALEELADALGASAGAGSLSPLAPPPRPSGAITVETMAAAIAAVQPEGAIVMDEGNMSSGPYFALSAGAPPHSYLNLTGGAIGLGLPAATGAAVACPDRPVIAIQADGSAMYTVQALWTQAQQKLNVTTVLCSNRSYKVLGIELARAGVKQPGPNALSMIDLSNPKLDWVRLSESMGVPASRVDSAEALARELERSLAEPGPHLIEVPL